jgi:hypothetical protein
LSTTAPGIPRTPQSRQPVRLTITAVPELTPVSEKTQKNPQKSFLIPLPNFP